MEKTEWLIDKLRRQYDSAAGAPAMLTTLQLLQQELTAYTATEATLLGKIVVIMPAPQWNTNMDGLLDAYDAETNRGEDEQKMVFELEPYSGNDVADEETAADSIEVENVQQMESVTIPDLPPTTEVPLVAEKPEPVQAKFISIEMPPPAAHTAYIPMAEPVAEVLPEPQETKKAETTVPASITPFAAGDVPPSIEAVEMPKPLPDTDQKSLNDLLEKPVTETSVRFQEPVKDLKRAISINERYQYINNLFSGDEVAFDRSIKTINSFNVFSEAEYWMRRELATRYGWEDTDTLVQQLYGLVSRRFS